MSDKLRQMIERRILRRTIATLLAAGYKISVNDGEETTLRWSTDRKAIYEATRTTDEDWLLVHEGDERRHCGFVRFIYGNDGWDVINDYSTHLELTLEPVMRVVDKLEELFA